MPDEIKVTVVDFGRKNLMLRYIDPMTGKQKHKSAGTSKPGDALKAAGKWQDELRSGRYVAPVHTTWAAFRERYEDEVLSSLSPQTDGKVSSVFNTVERLLNPQRLPDLNAARLSHYQAKLRDDGRTEATIKGHLAHLKAALSWAVRMGLLARMPAIEMPKRAKAQKLMKGRPITGEEFERMLAAVPKVVLADITLPKRKGRRAKPFTAEEQSRRDAVVDSWRHYLQGLWWSGLRLAESLELHWDRDDKLCVDLSGRHPMLRIPAALEKGNQDRLLPIAPEFAEFLLRTPSHARRGHVLSPMPQRPGRRLAAHRVGELVAAIGEQAGVKVNTTQAGKTKHATAHDLRRSFGERWASRVMPQVLMQLMRHENIETTMRYYVGRNAQSAAAVLWEAHRAANGNTSGNTDRKTGDAATGQSVPTSSR